MKTSRGLKHNIRSYLAVVVYIVSFHSSIQTFSIPIHQLFPSRPSFALQVPPPYPAGEINDHHSRITTPFIHQSFDTCTIYMPDTTHPQYPNLPYSSTQIELPNMHQVKPPPIPTITHTFPTSLLVTTPPSVYSLVDPEENKPESSETHSHRVCGVEIRRRG